MLGDKIITNLNKFQKRYEILPKVPIEKKKKSYLPLERLWSYLTIKQLLDQRDAAEGDADDKDNSSEKKALALALKVWDTND